MTDPAEIRAEGRRLLTGPRAPGWGGVMDKHCGICGATTEPLQPETGGVLGGFMECVDAVACLIRAAQVDEPEAALASPVDPEEEP